MWSWNLIIVLLAIFVLWWALTRQASFTEVPNHAHSEHDDSHHEDQNAPQELPSKAAGPVEVSMAAPDDLKIIEGIGPRIAGVLASAGMTKFSELAASDPQKIKDILSSADERLGRISDPTSWPEQARLAAQGDFEGLQKLQDNLKGGRRN